MGSKRWFCSGMSLSSSPFLVIAYVKICIANGRVLCKISAPITSGTIKLTPFWSRKPEVWFLQVEVQFELAGVTINVSK